MFTNLIESKRKRDKRFGGTAVSVVAHAALIGAAVAVTANAGKHVIEEHRDQDVKFAVVKPPPPPPEPVKPPPPDVVVKPPPPKGFQVLTAPIKIPDKIPDVDLSKAVTNEADFSGKGVEGGTAKGVAGGKPTNSDQPLFSFQVEKQALARPDSPKPQYPSMLESGGVNGEVLAQFVVDTSGRMLPSTFKVLKSTNDLFSQSVKRALEGSRFFPAQVGGHAVAEMVQQTFTFNSVNK